MSRSAKSTILLETPDWVALNCLAFCQEVLSYPPIYLLDPELSGIILMAKNKEIAHQLRNSYGSQQFLFSWILMTWNREALGENLVCDLPIAPHWNNDGVIISHKTGKKTETIFKKQAVLERYALWNAETHFLRHHQLRIHAHEVGLGVIGENFYEHNALPTLQDFKRNVKSNRKHVADSGRSDSPLYGSICVHLEKIVFNFNGERYLIEAPLPKKFAAMLKIIKRWG